MRERGGGGGGGGEREGGKRIRLTAPGHKTPH